MTQAKNESLDEELEALAKRLDELEHDPIMRMASANYKALVRKAKAKIGISHSDPAFTTFTKRLI
jgi:hypothetical protein